MSKLSIGLVMIKQDKFERDFLNAIRNHINDGLSKIGQGPTQQIQEIIRKSISNQPEWDSLKNGKLKADFGIPDGYNIDILLDIWSKEFEVKTTRCKVSAGQITGGIGISLIEESYSASLSSYVADIQSKGGTVFWLQWLLLAGNNVLVKDYSVVYNLNSINKQYSRSGDALMKFKAGDTFKVDARFAGTDDDNFITRALSNIETDLLDIVWKELDKYL